MASAASVPGAATTQDERTMAVLAHVLQMIGGWIAPLVIFFLRRQSRFVSFHALQVLLFEIVCMIVTIFAVALVFLAIGLQFALGGFSTHGSNGPPAIFVLFFGVFWIPFVSLAMLRLVFAIIYGIKAGRGEWAEYPLLGKLARRILGIGPDGGVVVP